MWLYDYLALREHDDLPEAGTPDSVPDSALEGATDSHLDGPRETASEALESDAGSARQSVEMTPRRTRGKAALPEEMQVDEPADGTVPSSSPRSHHRISTGHEVRDGDGEPGVVAHEAALGRASETLDAVSEDASEMAPEKPLTMEESMEQLQAQRLELMTVLDSVLRNMHDG
jgi:hypothetical protein